MFDRTIQSIERIQEDTRAFSFYATLITQCFFVLYYIGAMLLHLGAIPIHITLLVLTVFALAFFIFTETPTEIRPFKTRRWIRVFIRYAKHCVHLIAISLAIFSLYATTAIPSPFSIILLILAILAFLIQVIGELLGFICRRYFEDLKTAALADTELLRSFLGKVQGGFEAYKSAKDGLVSFPEKAASIGIGLKDKISHFFSKKD